MSEPNRDFGKLLSQGLKSIAAREHKSILLLEDELGYEMNGSLSRWSIEKWRQGTIPADPGHIADLARACVQRGGMDKQWLTGFLTRSSFLHREVLIQELFPGKDQSGPNVRRNIPGRPYERLVGRDQEVIEIEKFLSARHRTGVVCLIGMGGVGKTALALEIAHRMHENYYHLPPDDRFEAIIWVTAKQAELLPARHYLTQSLLQRSQQLLSGHRRGA